MFIFAEPEEKKTFPLIFKVFIISKGFQPEQTNQPVRTIFAVCNFSHDTGAITLHYFV